MADVAVTVRPIIQKIGEILVSLMKEEFILIYGVEKNVAKLKDNLSTILCVIKEAEERQLEETHLRAWLVKLKDAAYDADDIIDTFATEALRWKQKENKLKLPSSLREAAQKSDIAKQVREISERLEMITKEKDLFNLNFSSRPGGERPGDQSRFLTSSFVNTEDVVGRDVDRDKLVNLVLSDELSKDGRVTVIPIVGMGGLGKTTLAQLVFSDHRVGDRFKTMMWVCVTADFDLLRILRAMLQSHTKMEYGDNLSREMLESLLLDILRGKRFFLVLDDVWIQDYKQWDDIQRLLKTGDKGSRVLVTSRTREVCRVMGTHEPYPLDYLPEDKCWTLFEEIAFVNADMPRAVREELEEIGRQIVSKCQGLPLAVKSMAGILRDNIDVEKWQDILSSSIWELDDEDQNADTSPNILPALRLSYNHLPSHLKQCFSYCSIFPKAHVFIKEDLVKLWIAQGFVLPTKQKTAEKIAIEFFEGLLTRFFFQIMDSDNSKRERYMMHDLIHDLARSISSPHCCQVKDFNPRNRHQDSGCTAESRHISLFDQNLEQAGLMIADTSKKARTILLPTRHMKDFGVALTKMLSSLKYLRALDLSSSNLQELPSSIEGLKLLRYLDLSRTEINVLPNSICNLYNLQVLKLLGCVWLYQLPEDFCELVNLCYLELDEMFWFKCIVLPPRIGSLTNLHNLHSFYVGHEEGYGIEELENMVFLTGTLRISKLENAVNAKDANLREKKHIRKLVLEWSTDKDVSIGNEVVEENVLEDLRPHPNLQELQIHGYRGSRAPTWMRDDILQNLVTLSLKHCSKWKILSLGGLPRLAELRIKGMQELEELSEGQFLSLQRLKISNCSNLSKLPYFFPNLRALKIKKCPSLKALPVTPSLTFSILVDNLALESWEDVICQVTFQDDQGQIVQESWPSFIKLIELKVINCPKLPNLPEIFAPQKLEISKCGSIHSLPPHQFAQRFQQAALDGCEDGTLVKAIPNSSSLFSLVISNIPNLTTLPKWPQLQELKALYISNWQDLLSLPEGETEGSLQRLTSLKFLSIRGCPRLVTLPDRGLPIGLECLTIASCSALRTLGGPHTLSDLTSLKDLSIEFCPLLQSFPEDGLPSTLQHLHIEGCPQLIESCKEDGTEWPKIMNVPDLEIQHEELPSTSAEQMTEGCSPWWHMFLRCVGLCSRMDMEVTTSSEQGILHSQ